MTKHIQHSLNIDKMHIVMPNTEQLMRDKLADSLKDFNQWVDLIRNGEAEVTGLTVTRKRTWVGLTADEREQVQAESYGKVPHHVALIAAVEAKLKEKNK